MKLEAASKDEKGDIIVKYTAEEARSLKNYNELPDNASWLRHLTSKRALDISVDRSIHAVGSY